MMTYLYIPGLVFFNISVSDLEVWQRGILRQLNL